MKIFDWPITLFFISSLAFGLLAMPTPVWGMEDPKIGPRDILDISVYDEPNLSLTVVVSASGEFSFPLLKRVKAAGRTADELGLHMEKRLKDEQFLNHPTVTVQFKEQRFATVTLAGAIQSPGVVSIYPGMRLQELLAKQGGTLMNQAGRFIHVQRESGLQFHIDREELENASDPSLNISLQPGDLIMIPEADKFYVLGAVVSPGGFPLTRSITLGDALGLAGGRKENGGKSLLWHHHKPNGKAGLITFTYQQYQNDPEVRSAAIHPGDSLYVTQNDYVFVGGKVQNPGAYPWEPDMTLRGAILKAGDRSFEAGNTILLIRTNADDEQVKNKYSYSRIKKGSQEDISVIPGDIINVSANPILNIPLTLKKINPFGFTPIEIFE